jgi:hypothetical protein
MLFIAEQHAFQKAACLASALKGRYSGRASLTHMIDIVPVKSGKTLFFSFFAPRVFRI